MSFTHFTPDKLEEKKQEDFTQYKIAAEKGDKEAQFHLGNSYQKGKGVKQNLKEAAHWYQLAADQGHAKAQYRLATFYYAGKGVAKKDIKQTIFWLQKSVAENCAEAQESLATLYLKGHGVKVNEKEALRLFHLAAENGERIAQCKLGLRYQVGLGVEEDAKKAAELLRLSANQGIELAQYHLGWMYAFGYGVEKNLEEAIRLYHLAAKREVLALFNLGVIYENGNGVKKDIEKALHFYTEAAAEGQPHAQYHFDVLSEKWNSSSEEEKKSILDSDTPVQYKPGIFRSDKERLHLLRLSADLGHPDAQNLLGLMHYEGRGTEKDDSIAIRWYRLAAEQKLAPAEYNMGVVLSDFSQEFTKSLYWFRLSADQGYYHAQHTIAICFEKGIGLPIDDKEAVRFYHLAAYQGFAYAQYALGKRYEKGRGVEHDLHKAIHFYYLASEKGNSAATNDFIRLSSSSMLDWFLMKVRLSEPLPLTLASMYQLIKSQLKRDLLETDRQQFYSVMNVIQIIEAQKGWINTSDSLINYQAKLESKPLGKIIDTILPVLKQDQVRKETLDMDIKSYEFTNHLMQKLYHDINDIDGLYYAVFEKNKSLKNKANIMLCAALEEVNPKWRREREIIKVKTNEEQKTIQHETEWKLIHLPDSIKSTLDTYSIPTYKDIYDLCSLLGGRYKPFNQSNDPLHGKKHPIEKSYGFCHGHFKLWAKEIFTKGKYSSHQRVIQEVLNDQMDQAQGSEIAKYSFSNRKLTDITECLNKIFKDIRPDFIYGIQKCFSDQPITFRSSAHITGIRMTPFNKQIEFFDANMGLFCFLNLSTFKIWFSFLLTNMYFERNGFISVKEYGAQPEYAVPSLPYIVPASISFEYPIITFADLQFQHALTSYYSKINMAAHVSLVSDIKIDDDKVLSRMSYIHNIPLKDKKNNLDLKAYINYSNQLKNRVCDKIDSEIKSIQPKHQDETIAFLNELKKCIQNAGLSVTLNAIILHCLGKETEQKETHAKENHAKETYDNVLRKRSPKTHDALIQLTKTDEINPLSLTILHVEVLLKLEKILKHIGYNKKYINKLFESSKLPITVQIIMQHIMNYKKSESLAFNTLFFITNTCRKKYTDIISNVLDWRSRQTVVLYDILRELDPSNPDLLFQTITKLDDFVKNYEFNLSDEELCKINDETFVIRQKI